MSNVQPYSQGLLNFVALGCFDSYKTGYNNDLSVHGTKSIILMKQAANLGR